MRHRHSKQHRDPEALEARRLQAAALFAEGLSRAAVARQLGVTRASAGRWYQQWKERGEAGLRSQGKPGPDPRLSEATRQELEEALLAGPEAAGYATELWTLPRVRRLIEERFGVRYHLSHVWLLLRQLGFTWQKPTPAPRSGTRRPSPTGLSRSGPG